MTLHGFSIFSPPSLNPYRLRQKFISFPFFPPINSNKFFLSWEYGAPLEINSGFSPMISYFDIDSNVIKTCPPDVFQEDSLAKGHRCFPCFQGSFRYCTLALGCVQVQEKERRLPFPKLYLIL